MTRWQCWHLKHAAWKCRPNWTRPSATMGSEQVWHFGEPSSMKTSYKQGAYEQQRVRTRKTNGAAVGAEAKLLAVHGRVARGASHAADVVAAVVVAHKEGRRIKLLVAACALFHLDHGRLALLHGLQHILAKQRDALQHTDERGLAAAILGRIYARARNKPARIL